eukprot:SAG31_NODE_91_length_26366_cov_6.792211_15_plen_660_part_00
MLAQMHTLALALLVTSGATLSDGGPTPAGWPSAYDVLALRWTERAQWLVAGAKQWDRIMLKTDDDRGGKTVQFDEPAPRRTEPTMVHIKQSLAAAVVGKDFVGHAWDYTPTGNQSVLKANLSDPRLIALVKNLGISGGSVLRIGGGAGDCTVYEVGPQPYPTVECGVNRWAAGGVQYNAPCTSSCPGSNISGVSWCLTMQRWDELNAFARATGFKIIYGLSGFHGQGGKHAVGGWKQSRVWDPTNVKALLNYSAKKKFVEKGTLLGFEMGNEITENEVGNGTYWGERFLQLAALVNQQWPDKTARPGLYGPDQTRSGNYGCKSCFPNWTKSFLDQAAPVLAGVTFHAYPGHSQGASPEHLGECNILNNDMLQKTLNIATNWNNLVQSYNPPLPLILGEASACSGGGAEGISDRFAISFWWADTLGSMARLGVRGVNRQAILSNNYSLIDIDHHGIVGQGVHPDYYISYFWKQLMGETVLAVDNPSVNTTGLRVYAHCTKAAATEKTRPAGAVSVVAININSNRSVSLGTTLDGGYTVHVITGGDGGALTSDEIKLNGEPYSVGAGASATMPLLRGVAAAAGTAFQAPPHSISFLVFEHAGAQACTTHHKSDDEDADESSSVLRSYMRRPDDCLKRLGQPASRRVWFQRDNSCSASRFVS